MYAGVGESSVSHDWIRPELEGRPSPGGLLCDDTFTTLSIFSRDKSDGSLLSHDLDEVDIQPDQTLDHDYEGNLDGSNVEYPSCVMTNIASYTCNKFVIDHSIVDNLCKGPCAHYLGGCRVQLNSCSFYRELFLSHIVDPDADYLYHEVCHGFDVIDPTCPAWYHCENYDSISDGEFKPQMDEIVCQEA